MIITCTQNAAGHRRVYLGGKASLECLIEPKPDGSWSFHLDEAITGAPTDPSTRRDWSIHMLLALARELDVAPDQLATVPFEAIAALHTAASYAGRRIPAPRRAPIENGYIATPPNITRPRSDFRYPGQADHRRRHR
jgi:hypothetical protein